jgi:hypothetical protein
MSVEKFTRHQLHAEVLALREAFGTIDFWEKPGAVETANKAIWFVFLNNPGATDSDRLHVESVLEELQRRWVLVTLNPRANNETDPRDLNIPRPGNPA